MKRTNILLIVASKDFQEDEFEQTRDVLRKAGFNVDAASDDDLLAIGKTGRMELEVDMQLDDVYVPDYAGIFLIGGPGALECLEVQEMNRILNEAMLLQKVYGAICISPRILARANVMIDKKATGWNGDGKLKDIYANNNVTYVNEPVVVDENVITADGPDAAKAFGEAIVKTVMEYEKKLEKHETRS